MALTIEDGSGVAGADSYATVAELQAYAGKRGYSVPSTDSECEPLLHKAMDYLQSQEERFKGYRVLYDQSLAWPRYDVCLNGYDWPSDEIPPQLKEAQMILAIEAQANDLLPTRLPGDGGAITQESVGPISVSYAEPVNRSSVPRFAKADGLLAQLYNGGGYSIRVSRS